MDGQGSPVRVDLSADIGDSHDRWLADAAGHLWMYDIWTEASGPDGGTLPQNTWSPGAPLFGPPPSSEPLWVVFLAKQTANAPRDPASIRALLSAAANGPGEDHVSTAASPLTAFS